MDTPPLGEQQLEILRFVAMQAPVTAREVAEHFGETHGLARTTVLTVLERLREKGYLVRRKKQGVYLYAPAVSTTDVLQNIVQNFVEKTLGGSIAPLVAYLTRAKNLSEEEVAVLHRITEELEGEKEEKK